MISIDHFAALDLRVATILSAEEHPNADRLVVLKVKIGEEERQIVAGIRGHATLGELPGQQIVVVANLEPATLRGVESQGMLLAAKDGDRVVLVGPKDAVASGSSVS